jgi:D-3-phosphoglycerate dehydrogenase/(S)-sulfolactate dehydrogenase
VAEVTIVVPEDVLGPALDELVARYSSRVDTTLWSDLPRLRAELSDARALIVRNLTEVDAPLLRSAPRLEVLGRVGVGMDNVDVATASELGVVICYAPDENAVSVAEHVFALVLGLARKLGSADRSVRAGRWERRAHTGFELYGKTLGLLGLGKIGFRVAIRARAFGMGLIAYDPYLSPHHANVTESGACLTSLEEVLRSADIVTVHLPLTDETRGLLNADRLAAMKPGAVLVNTARGGIVDEAALYAALSSGHLGGAALDVREAEPPGASPLHELGNVLLTPHIAAWTHEAQARVLETVTADVDRVLRGQPALRYWNFARPNRQALGVER